MSLAAIMTQISVIEGNIAGIAKANDNAPASMNTFPQFVNFPEAGPQIIRTPNLRTVVHLFTLELHALKQVLPQAEYKLRPFLELTLNAFDSNLTLNGSCDNAEIVSYEYGVLSYNGEQHLGISFKLKVTEMTPYDFVA